MPTFIAAVPGIVSGPGPGRPSALTCGASRPSRPAALEYQAMTVCPAASVARLGSLPYWRPGMKFWFGVAGERPAWTQVPSVPAKACSVEPSPPTVAACALAYDWAPLGFTWPGCSAQEAPPSAESAVLVSRWGSLESVVRNP